MNSSLRILRFCLGALAALLAADPTAADEIAGVNSVFRTQFTSDVGLSSGGLSSGGHTGPADWLSSDSDTWRFDEAGFVSEPADSSAAQFPITQPESSAEHFSHSCTPPEWNDDLAQDAPVRRFRQGALQGISVSAGRIAGGSDSLEIQYLAASVGFAVPLGSPKNLLFVSPMFRTDFLDAPSGTDVPDTLYETGLKFFHRHEISDQLGSLFIVTPSVRSDFTTGQDAVRIFGLAMLTWNTVPDKLTLSGGFVYLDRSDISALPAVGLLWTPTPRWSIDLQFPQPKISCRVAKNGADSESWIYLSGGFGGNTWAVTRNTGATDELTLSDLRMMVGFEKLIADNRGWFAEAGWVFDRELEYVRVPAEQSFSDAYLLRTGISF